MDISQHLNKESVIRYYLKFLPPKNCGSILDIGAGKSVPYKGMLSRRTRKYRSVDIRKSHFIDIVADISKLSQFINEIYEWGWCVEVLEHLGDKKQDAVNEIMKVCQNCVFTFPKPEFVMTDKKGNIINSFKHDKGHTEVIVNWSQFEKTHNISDLSTKNGRGIFVLIDKDYIPPPKIRGYF